MGLSHRAMLVPGIGEKKLQICVSSMHARTPFAFSSPMFSIINEDTKISLINLNIPELKTNNSCEFVSETTGNRGADRNVLVYHSMAVFIHLYYRVIPLRCDFQMSWARHIVPGRASTCMRSNATF